MDNKRLHNFQTNNEFQNYLLNTYQEPFASLTFVGENSAENHLDGYRIDFDQSASTMENSMINTPLTFEILTGGTIYWTGAAKSITYTINGGSEITITAPASISVQANDVVKIFGNNDSYYGNVFSGESTVRYYVYGNIMSLVNKSGFTEEFNLSESYEFAGLFTNNINILSHQAKQLLLPATGLTDFCYMEMFKGCLNMTIAPELPAKKLKYNCYQGMFYGDVSITESPELNANTLVSGCYQEMFYGCTTLATITCKATYIKAQNCTKDWVVNVAENGKFNNSPYQKNWEDGSDGIPLGWICEGKDISDLGYVTDGLLFFFDGILNGLGMQHNASATTWNDLSDNGYNMTLQGSATSGGMWTDKFLKMNCLSGEFKTTKNLQTPSYGTLEVVYRVNNHPSGLTTGIYPIFTFPYNTNVNDYNYMGFYLTTNYDIGTDSNIPVLNYRQKSANVGGYRSAGTSTETDTTNIHYFSQYIQRPLATSSSNVIGFYDVSGMTLAQGNWTYDADIADATTSTGLFSIGNLASFQDYDVELYSVRMYDRKLTESELQQNWRNDKRRYIN